MFDEKFFGGDTASRRPARSGDYSYGGDPWETAYPALFAYLAQDTVGGVPRALSVLKLCVSEGMACLVLSDREYGRVLFHKAKSFVEGLECMNALLQRGEGDFREDKYNKPESLGARYRQRTKEKR